MKYTLEEIFKMIDEEFCYDAKEMKFFKDNVVDYEVDVMGDNNGKGIIYSIDLINNQGDSLCEFHIQEPEHVFDFRSDYFCHQ